ncbi:MAG: T9SS type A sorting domain-containing protein [Candidatus Cloacimonadaceae bacterium]|nr:T9SS type A sorting domain-containing protein [Candidatus Cloacimonadaceae bacterium]
MNRILCLAMLILPCVVFGLTYNVKLDGSGDFDAIQPALNACSPGDTVLVHPGLYVCTLNIPTDNISLFSLEAITGNRAYIDSTIVDGAMTSTTLLIWQNRQNIVVRGLSFINAKGAGIAVSLSSASLINCKISNCLATNGAGLNISGSSVFLSGLDVFANRALNMGGGLYTYTPNGIENNIVFDPVNRCSIYNNRAGNGQDIFISGATSDLTIYLGKFSVANPTNYYAGIRPQALVPYELSLDFLNAHHEEIHCDLYVAPWGDDANDGLRYSRPLRTISEAIYRIAADSLYQTTVHLLPGLYSRTENAQVFPIALKSWTKVKGSGMDNTRIVGSPHPLFQSPYYGSDNIFVAYRQNVLSLADMVFSTENTDKGNAIYCAYGGSLNLRNIRIHDIHPDNIAVLELNLSSRYESLWENVIIENDEPYDRSWINIDGGMAGRIVNCKFRNATQTYQSSVNLTSPLIKIIGDKNLSFENCEFSNLAVSTVSTAVISITGVDVPAQRNRFSFKNCLFSNLSSANNIMILSSRNNPYVTLSNCTFGGNTSSGPNLMVRGIVDVTNCIFYNNTQFQIRTFSNTFLGEELNLNISHSLIRYGLNGLYLYDEDVLNYTPDNLDLDPLFRGGVDVLDALCYSLAAGSPCINSGTPDTLGLFLPAYDLAGNWRVWDGRIDMGCFEYGSEPWVSNDDPFIPQPLLLSLDQNYPNPFNPSTMIAFTIPASSHCRLDVYNMRGQKVATLLNDTRIAGKHSVVWNGLDDRGSKVSSGIYIYRLFTPNAMKTAKMILMK